MNSLLNEISQFPKSKLKSTSTKIYYLNGKQFLRENKDGEEKEINVENNDQQLSNDSTIYWSKKCGYLVDVVPDLSIDEIIPRLYLSGDDVASNRNILHSKNITHILNLTSNIPNRFESEIKYKEFLMYDLPSQEILSYLDESFKFIEGALSSETNSVLVHCNAGISRSPSFVIAYLMQKRISKTFKEAYELVKLKRSKICPNKGFVKQLIEFESQLANH